MESADDVDDIRARKREELRAAAESPAGPVHVDGQADLRGLVADGGVVLADFYADWCGPCKTIEPIVEEVAAETPATVAKVDVDANQALAREYGVRGVPTLVLFAGGEPVERVVGVTEKAELARLVDQHA